MTMLRPLAWNTMIQIAGKGLSTLLGLLALGLITRYLGTKGFGEYTTVNAFLQFFGILIDFGLVIISLSMISEPQAAIARIFSNVFTLRIVSALVFLGAAPVLSLLFPYPPEVRIGIAILSISFFFIALNQILIGLFQKNLQMGKVALSEIAGRIVLISTILFFMRLNGGFYSVLAAIILGSFGNFFINFLYAFRFTKISLAFDFSLWKEILRRAWPIGLSIFFNLLYLHTGIIVLSLIAPPSEVGLYGAAFRILEVGISIPMMFMGLILPLLVDAWARNNREAFRAHMDLAFRFLTILGIPLVVGSLFVATPLMEFIAGQEFRGAGAMLKILSVAVAFVFFSGLFTHTAVAIKRQKTMLWGFFLAAVAALIGYIYVVPKLFGVGAALTTAAAEGIVLIFSATLVHFSTRAFPSVSIMGKVMLATGGMAGALTLLKDQHVLVSIGGAIVAYGVGIFLTGAIKIQTMKDLLRFQL